VSGARLPGATCGARDTWPLDRGTSALWWTPLPGVDGALLLRLPPRVEPPLSCPVQVPDVGFLFNSCRAPARGLSEADYAQAADDLGVEVAAIRAVAAVESAGQAFDESGRPTILYERHYFHRLTGGRHALSDPELSQPGWGGHGSFNAQYRKLERAHALNPGAALQSVSWGRFQIMGTHYQRLGYASPQHMAQAMARSESEHLRAFVRFLQTDRALLRALRQRDWAGFARRYNGSAYRRNRYDTRLAEEYQRLTAPPPAPQPPLRTPAPAPAPTRPAVQPPVPLRRG
jgi:hypothetical protein